MDPVTLSMAKKYANKQRIAYEDKKSITVLGGASNTIDFPFVDLIGLEVLDRMPGRMFLTTPVEKPKEIGELFYYKYGIGMEYSNYNGLLDKPCLLMSGTMEVCCPSFFKDDELANIRNYDALVYAFEEVSDTMGLGITLKKGWHAVNTKTFANEPFDPDVYHFLAISEWFESGSTAETAEYAKSIFYAKENIKYTITQKNIRTFYGDNYPYNIIVSYEDIFDFDGSVDYYDMYAYTSFAIDETQMKMERLLVGSATITYTDSIKTVDPKFLPKGGVGYTERRVNTLTYDGDMTGKEIFPALEDSIAMVKISDVPFSMDDFVGLGVIGDVVDENAYRYEDRDDLTIMEPDGLPSAWVAGAPDNSTNPAGLYLLVMMEDYSDDTGSLTKGVYAYRVYAANTPPIYVNKVDFYADTVVPIDPKFIPWDSAPGGGSGGGIPFIMLTTGPTGDGATLTDEELAFFENLARTEETPMVCVMFWLDGNLYSAPCTIYSDEEGEGYAGQTAVKFPGFDYLLARLVVDLGSGTVAVQPLSAVSMKLD